MFRHLGGHLKNPPLLTFGMSMLRTPPLTSWPIAVVTVRLDAVERAPLPTAHDVRKFIEQAITGKNTLVIQDYYDNQPGIMLGQTSPYADQHFLLIPADTDDPRPFFLLDRTYSSVQVVSHSWGATRYMNEYTNADIILRAQELAQDIGIAYLEFASHRAS